MYYIRKIPEPFQKKAKISSSVPQVSILQTEEKKVSRKKQTEFPPLAAIAILAYFSAEKKDGA